MVIKLRHRSYSPLRRREAYAGLLFVLPWIASLLVFTSYPIIAAFYFSFTRYNIIEPPKWVGLENYRTMFSNDPYFWISVKNSLYYALVSVPLSLVIALLLALLLNANTRFIGMYRTLFYLPALVPPVRGHDRVHPHVQPRGRTAQQPPKDGGSAGGGVADRP